MSQHPDAQPDGRLLYPSLAVVKPTGWLLVNWLFFWPSAAYSLGAHWNRIDPAVAAGDLIGARAHAAKVRTFGIAALCIGSVIIIVYLTLSAPPTVTMHG